MADLDRKTFDFLSAMTGVVVALYVGAAVYAMAAGDTDFKEFSGAVGPLAGLLLGYWVRGEK